MAIKDFDWSWTKTSRQREAEYKALHLNEEEIKQRELTYQSKYDDQSKLFKADPEYIERERRKKQQENEDERQRRLGPLRHLLGDRYSYERVSLANFVVETKEQAAMLERHRKIASNIVAFVREKRNVIWMGTAGTGKDHLASALAYQAVEHVEYCSCYWVNGARLYSENTINKDLFKELVGHSILYLSDPIPAGGAPAPWKIDELFRVIDERYRTMKPIWITVNADSVKDMEFFLTTPVVDRVKDNAIIFECFWPSYRERASVQPAPAVNAPVVRPVAPHTGCRPLTTAEINNPECWGDLK